MTIHPNIKRIGIHVNKFITELQNSDQQRKNRWLISLSIIAMILILSMWLRYFDILVAPTTPDIFSEEQIREDPQSSLPKGGGFATMYNGFIGSLNSLTNTITGSRDYTLQPEQ